MKPDCMRVENAIWDSIADGTDLPEDIRQHAQSCPKCLQVLAETERSIKLLQCAAPYPDAPDCRQAVLERIAARPRVGWARRFAWAAAPAAVLAAAAMILPMRTSYAPAPAPVAKARVEKPAVPEAVVVEPAPKEPPVVVHVPQPRPMVASTRTKQAQRDPYPAGKTERMARDRVVVGVELAKAPTASIGRPVRSIEKWTDDDLSVGYYAYPEPSAAADYSPKPTRVEPESTMVAAVSVEWSPGPATENLSYDFTEEDAATGAITTGSVERSGNNIEIRMESEPSEPETPERGELSNEESPAA